MSDPQSYPVTVEVEPKLTDRNRMTVLFRSILIIPHLILVGASTALLGLIVFIAVAAAGAMRGGNGGFSLNEPTTGLFGIVAGVIVILAWFAVVFTGRFPQGLQSVPTSFLRWSARASAYGALLTDVYPPFGEGDGNYPLQVNFVYQTEDRNRLTVFFRIFMVIPHAIVLALLSVAAFFTELFALVAIVATGNHPAGLYNFNLGIWRWNVRVQAYVSLVTDVYPPFSLSA
jgi:hypothetical protein